MRENDRLDQISHRIIGAAIEEAQLLSYLRLAKKRVGLLMNFHVPALKNGLKRIVNEFPDAEWEKTQASQAE